VTGSAASPSPLGSKLREGAIGTGLGANVRPLSSRDQGEPFHLTEPPGLETPWTRDFHDLRYEWRRVFAETLGTFLLVLVAAGAAVVNAQSHGRVPLDARVVAPGLMVMAIIYFMGTVSGAHLNPAVTVGFALRRNFPWKRVPGYVGAQLCGSVLAAGFLRLMFSNIGDLGATAPGPGVHAWSATLIEVVLTTGLVSVILGTASGGRNVGTNAAIAVAGYIILAGLWAAPVSGASMNPARSLGPALAGGHWTDWWVYVLGPMGGAVVAVGIAWILRGPPSAVATKVAEGASQA
jgi:aquaporin Z